MMCRREACLIIAGIESGEQSILNFGVQNIESTPIKPAVKIY